MDFGLIKDTTDQVAKHGYIRVRFENGVTAYDHKARGYVNYHFHTGRGVDVARERAAEFITQYGGRLLPDAQGRVIVKVAQDVVVDRARTRARVLRG